MKQVMLDFARDKKSAFDKQRKKKGQSVTKRVRVHFHEKDSLELDTLKDTHQLRFITRLEYVSKFIIVKKKKKKKH